MLVNLADLSLGILLISDMIIITILGIQQGKYSLTVADKGISSKTNKMETKEE